eukprot:TRINITY_DN1926_c0_g2_i1.p1 TRINITY_DN1926_c0_g2~~TRINITY_DN1926_c0_g2_i1.p1  ORF type:complete len:330 (+),score=60.58 TRINITY_DN1926_c0_g2_i1:126-1115(+)
MTEADVSAVPVIDISALFGYDEDLKQQVAHDIGVACRDIGFFYVSGHGVDSKLVGDLFSEGKRFFRLPVAEKNQIAMTNSRVFRGYFEVGGELTSGRPDVKEGLYFCTELGPDHPDVIAEKPMHGANQWPDATQFPTFKEVVLRYMHALTQLGHVIMTGVAVSLGLDKDFFREQFTSQPFTPFRLFHYPSDPQSDGTQRWGVGEHTDYGVLTMLATDEVPGLEVKNRAGKWVQAPPIPGTFVVNIGDMLEIWTCGLYRATPHRVRNVSDSDRLSAPFFFDPNFECLVSPLTQFAAQASVPIDRPPIKYGDYILAKVLRVFPELKKDAIL